MNNIKIRTLLSLIILTSTTTQAQESSWRTALLNKVAPTPTPQKIGILENLGLKKPENAPKSAWRQNVEGVVAAVPTATQVKTAAAETVAYAREHPDQVEGAIVIVKAIRNATESSNK